MSLRSVRSEQFSLLPSLRVTLSISYCMSSIVQSPFLRVATMTAMRRICLRDAANPPFSPIASLH